MKKKESEKGIERIRRERERENEIEKIQNEKGKRMNKKGQNGDRETEERG